MQIGYAFLLEKCAPGTVAARLSAKTAPVRKKTIKDGRLLVPADSFPETENPLPHVAFALRHEGVNMQILAQVLPTISPEDMTAFVRAKPSGLVCRRAGWLWELFTGRSLDFRTTVSKYGPLFDPARYLTRAEGDRSAKWKIVFNGLGTPQWCATVERTEALEACMSGTLLERAAQWFDGIGRLNAERVLGWAYWNETKSSCELEKAPVKAGWAERFPWRLGHASDDQPFIEAYLCELQNEIVDHPFAEAYSYRTKQNWLANGNGASSVRYVPPSPDQLDDLMTAWREAAQRLSRQTDPIVAAAVVSFGFVYLHPFMDGNGRLSRFLIHQLLATSGRLGKERLLPVSVAMKRHELEYLEALEAFSKPARKAWQVTWTGGDPLCECIFLGHESIYRYWDATRQAEFLYRMAEEALDVHLQEAVDWLERFDKLDRAVNDAFDIPQALRLLMVEVYLNQGRLSLNFREKFRYRIPSEAMDWLEANGEDIIRGEAVF